LWLFRREGYGLDDFWDPATQQLGGDDIGEREPERFVARQIIQSDGLRLSVIFCADREYGLSRRGGEALFLPQHFEGELQSIVFNGLGCAPRADNGLGDFGMAAGLTLRKALRDGASDATGVLGDVVPLSF
jgi:hypothetical protein